MIRITDFDALIREMTLATPGVADYVLVANEKHLVRRLGDKTGIQLGVTLPSADPQVANEDNVAESNIVWIFILEKVDPASLSSGDELAHFQKLQDAATSIKEWLHSQKMNGNEFLEHLNLQSIHTDPEYQIGGWNGWSINFNFDTDGY